MRYFTAKMGVVKFNFEKIERDEHDVDDILESTM